MSFRQELPFILSDDWGPYNIRYPTVSTPAKRWWWCWWEVDWDESYKDGGIPCLQSWCPCVLDQPRKFRRLVPVSGGTQVRLNPICQEFRVSASHSKLDRHPCAPEPVLGHTRTERDKMKALPQRQVDIERNGMISVAHCEQIRTATPSALLPQPAHFKPYLLMAERSAASSLQLLFRSM